MKTTSTRGPRGFTRREWLAFGVGAFVVASIPAARRRRPGLIQRQLPLMGTLAEIGVVHRDPRVAHAAIDRAFDALVDVERAMTRFTATSDIGRVNAAAAHDGVLVSYPTAGVILEALRWAEASDGTFDPAVGKIVELWDVGHRKAPPPATAVHRLAGRQLHRRVDLGWLSHGPAVRFDDPDVALDLGGIAKGYGVDRAVAALRAAGVTDGLVNVGGDLFALGRSPEDDPWHVGIRSPYDPDVTMGRFDVTDQAVATSGDYFRYFEYRGHRYHHLMDPRTAAPTEGAVRSLTIQAATCMDADAVATAAFGLPLATAVERARHWGVEVVASV